MCKWTAIILAAPFVIIRRMRSVGEVLAGVISGILMILFVQSKWRINDDNDTSR